MIPQDYTKQVAIAFADWHKFATYLATDSDWNQFLQSEAYQSIPQPIEELTITIGENLREIDFHGSSLGHKISWMNEQQPEPSIPVSKIREKIDELAESRDNYPLASSNWYAYDNQIELLNEIVNK